MYYFIRDEKCHTISLDYSGYIPSQHQADNLEERASFIAQINLLNKNTFRLTLSD
jgi:hypothetical protein